MDLNKLFKAQAELDKHIVEEKGLQGQDLLKKKVVALICELYECVNEFPAIFKFWSNKKNNHEKGLIEFADIVHFAISIANEIGLEKYEYGNLPDRDLSTLVIGITNLATIIPENPNKYSARVLLNWVIKLGYQLGFNEKQVIDAYFEKNKVNYARQKNGY